MPPHILSVSHDDALLVARRTQLEQRGYKVTSALRFKEAFACCQEGQFDLFILGHSIPYSDKEELIKAFRSHCPAPILSIWHPHERIIDTVEYIDFSDKPDALLRSVSTILAKRAET